MAFNGNGYNHYIYSVTFIDNNGNQIATYCPKLEDSPTQKPGHESSQTKNSSAFTASKMIIIFKQFGVNRESETGVRRYNDLVIE